MGYANIGLSRECPRLPDFNIRTCPIANMHQTEYFNLSSIRGEVISCVFFHEHVCLDEIHIRECTDRSFNNRLVFELYFEIGHSNYISCSITVMVSHYNPIILAEQICIFDLFELNVDIWLHH
jgi:hypothetical protein